MGCSQGWAGTDRNSTTVSTTAQRVTQTDAVLLNAQYDFAENELSHFQNLTSVKEIFAS
jgi:hypothetical protein